MYMDEYIDLQNPLPALQHGALVYKHICISIYICTCVCVECIKMYMDTYTDVSCAHVRMCIQTHTQRLRKLKRLLHSLSCKKDASECIYF